MKAKFKIRVVRPLDDNYSALSNMNVEKEEQRPADGVAVVHFAESVPMSTYLACFIVSDFVHKQDTVDAKGIGKDVVLRVFANQAQLNKTEFALGAGKALTEYYIDYFKTEYPLPKLGEMTL